MTLNKNIAASERLIVALDLPSSQDALRFVDTLGDCVTFYKIGLEVWAGGDSIALIEQLKSRGKRIFADLKLFDVPATVGRAVRNLSRLPIDFVTVHGNDAIMQAAADAKGSLKILAVTVLTSLDRGDLDDLGFQCDPEQLVLSRAKRAIALGCDGVISSGLELGALRRECDPALIAVTPGIRPIDNRPTDDQKRAVSACEALQLGADYLVVGRPIRDAANPREAAAAMQREIVGYFAQEQQHGG